MVHSNMANAIALSELLESVSSKLRSIVGKQLLRNAMSTKPSRKTSNVADTVVEVITFASGHFEKASTAMRNMEP